MKLFKSVHSLFILLICIILIWSSLIYSDDNPVDYVSPNRITFNIDGNILKIPYSRNYALGSTNENIIRAIIVIHGKNRNAFDYYNTILDAAKTADHAEETTIIIAPQFLIEDDIDWHGLPDNILFWDNGGWKIGHKSKNTISHPRPARISSFAIIDTILYRLAVNNTNLQTIVLAGHSAGGQFANRFAAGSQMEQTLSYDYGIHFRYITANPSSYLYLNEERRSGVSLNEFEIPFDPCPDYNEYKYGLESLNSYMSNAGAAQIRDQYKVREIVYLLGGDDNDPNASSLDKSEPAMLQGSHRLERGQIFYNYLKHYYGYSVWQIQKQAVLPNIGHSHEDVFQSDCGLYFLFDYGTCDYINMIEDNIPSNTIKKYSLCQNYPNPFNAFTTIRFKLNKKSKITIDIYNVTGERAAKLIDDEFLPAGINGISWDTAGFASGIYYYQLHTRDGHRAVKKMILLK
jgi:hypothetical protein